MTQDKWSKEIKEKFVEFEKKAKFILIEGAVMMSEDTYQRLVELIDYVIEVTIEETQENVGEWFEPEPPWWLGDEP